MKGKIKRKYPAFWKIRHRTGGIDDHPQRYHINVGKKYTGGDYRKTGDSKLKGDLSKRYTPRSNYGKIVHEGMGSFLEPPTHPSHYYRVKSSYGDTFAMSLEAAAESDWLNYKTRKKAKEILDSWKPLPLNDPRTQDWIHQVLGYFKDCYQGKNGSWNVSDLEINPNIDPIKNQDRHAGVHFIRKYYPHYRLTKKDLEEAYWGKKKRKGR